MPPPAHHTPHRDFKERATDTGAIMMVRANMMGLPADYCSSDAAADKEECSACATVDRTDLRLALRSVWSLGSRGDPSAVTGQQRRVLAALDRMAQVRDGGAYGEAVRTARRTIDGLGQGRDLPSDAAWLTTLSVIGGMVQHAGRQTRSGTGGRDQGQHRPGGG